MTDDADIPLSSTIRALRGELAEAVCEDKDQVKFALGTNLAMALSNQSIALGELGRREQALAAIEEAVTIRRELVAARADASLLDGIALDAGLAGSLTNQSNALRALGRRQQALAAIEEAVTIRRELVKVRPDVFLPVLAGSLNNQSNAFGELGRREQALAAVTQAVTILRELAAARPDVFLPVLEGSLNNQSIALRELGRREQALAAIAERHRIVQMAPELMRQRSTKAGLELALELAFPGVPLRVEDRGSVTWSLDEAEEKSDAAEPASYVVYCDEPPPEQRLAAIARLIEQAKPAHVGYRLRVRASRPRDEAGS